MRSRQTDGRSLRVAALPLALTISLFLASRVLGSEGSLATCAALDLHLVWQIEEAGTRHTVEPQRLLATVEGMMEARRACREGRVTTAIRTYEKLDLGPMQVGWLQ